MKKLKLYIACSLDGKIAKPDGDVRWLEELPNPDKTDHGYTQFLSGVDTTLMGYKTYEVVLGLGIDFPYKEQKNYVFSRRARDPQPFVEFVSGDIVSFTARLKEQEGKDIWLIGGGEINTLLLDAGLIDEIQVFIMPIVIGDGVPLFGAFPDETTFRVLEIKSFSTGAVMIRYEPQNRILGPETNPG